MAKRDRPGRRWRHRLVLSALVVVLSLAALLSCGAGALIGMPGRSHAGSLPPLTAEQRALAEELRRDVTHLASVIGPRHVGRPEGLRRSADWVAEQLEAAGLEVERETFEVFGVECANVVAEVAGRGARADEIVVVGAHHDSAGDIPAANDNASGVAALLALARRFAGTSPERTLRFVAFANEEPPWFQTEHMGSLVHARGCRQRGEDVVAMISLETIGYYSSAEGSQAHPGPLLDRWYPTTGDFIAFVGDVGSRGLVKEAIRSFRKHAAFPSEGGALPGTVPGVHWSDHWAFRQVGYPAIMVTDTAPFRYPHYHLPEDTAEKLDYPSFARVVDGLQGVVGDLAGE